VGWIASGFLRADLPRALLRAASLAVFATPGVVAGHGLGVLPAAQLLLLEGWHPFAWVPMVGVFTLGLVLLLAVPRWRRSRNAWPLDLAATLLLPTHPKLLFYGLEIGLLFRAGYDTIGSRWPLQIGVLLVVCAVHFLLARFAAARFGRSGWTVPAAIAGPLALAGGIRIALPSDYLPLRLFFLHQDLRFFRG
jgi:hypothetical protein